MTPQDSVTISNVSSACSSGCAGIDWLHTVPDPPQVADPAALIVVLSCPPSHHTPSYVPWHFHSSLATPQFIGKISWRLTNGRYGFDRSAELHAAFGRQLASSRGSGPMRGPISTSIYKSMHGPIYIPVYTSPSSYAWTYIYTPVYTSPWLYAWTYIYTSIYKSFVLCMDLYIYISTSPSSYAWTCIYQYT